MGEVAMFGRSGGKVVMVSGVVGMACAGVEVLVASMGVALHIEKGGTVLAMGFAGALLSMVVVALGAAARRDPTRWLGAVTVPVAAVTGIYGGTLVTIAMLGALTGGAMLLGGTGRHSRSDAA